MIELCKVFACHFIGDYTLQSDFLAKTKGENWYHTFIHCFLYCLPFAVVYGFNERILLLFVSHWIIDPLKARWNKIGYFTDQFLHLVIAYILYFFI
ncbi:MAG: protein of unknown function DUF3307 [Caudoviricetes sp.]|nr:MAG: protein of unknown function DUF3307 [Caudoviricetes sp.]